jgi:hypothetical protein
LKRIWAIVLAFLLVVGVFVSGEVLSSVLTTIVGGTVTVVVDDGLLLLYVNTCDWAVDEWNVYGFPYEDVLNAIDYYEPVNFGYIATSSKNMLEGDFFFANSSKSTETIINVTVQVYARNADSANLGVYVWDEFSYAELEAQALTPSWQWVNYTATTVLDTWTKIDGAKMNVGSLTNGGPYEIDCARLEVYYNSTS